MSIFKNFKESIIKAAERAGKARVQQELLRMSDRQLEDYGFSKALLLDGVNAWPWRTSAESSVQTSDPTSVHAQAVPASAGSQPVQSRRAVNQAINELSTYSDRELAELGVSRHGIEDAVRHGRPSVEAAFEPQKRAA